MIIPTKQLKNGFTMPVFGLGTWLMGGKYERDFNNDDAADIQAIQNALAAGLTHIDTAEIYANGYTETLVGQAIKNYDRAKIFLASKVKQTNLSADTILRSCEQSLKRLQTDYLDLYLMHRYSPDFPLKDSIKALDKLVDRGLVKNIGVSNFNKEHLAEAQNYADHKIVCDQVHYNLKYREPASSGLLNYCQNNDIFLVAWRPFSKGLLLQDMPDIVKQLADKYQKTPAQVAINWLISQPYVLTLSKIRNLEHLTENLGALDWTMEQSDVEKLRQEFPDQQDISDVVPLG